MSKEILPAIQKDGSMVRTARKSTTKRKSANAYVHSRFRNQSELAEDYVELIDDLIAEMGEARSVDIAKRLGVSHVTVSKAVGRLKETGLVRSEPYRSVFLTDAGRALARRSRERHRIVAEFLRSIGVSNETARLDAEGIEHHVSKETLKAMQAFLTGKDR